MKRKLFYQVILHISICFCCLWPQCFSLEVHAGEGSVKAADLDGMSGWLKDHVAYEGSLGDTYPVLSYFGKRDSWNGRISTDHKGIDFQMEVGTELVAPDNCKIVYTGYHPARGNWLVLYWKDGYYVEYQHLSEILVWAGLYVSEGAVIARSGDTGSGLLPHLHLEILQSPDGEDSIVDFQDNRTRIDPFPFIFSEEDEKPDVLPLPGSSEHK